MPEQLELFTIRKQRAQTEDRVSSRVIRAYVRGKLEGYAERQRGREWRRAENGTARPETLPMFDDVPPDTPAIEVETAEQTIARYHRALEQMRDCPFSSWVSHVAQQVLYGGKADCWMCARPVHDGPCVSDGEDKNAG